MEVRGEGERGDRRQRQHGKMRKESFRGTGNRVKRGIEGKGRQEDEELADRGAVKTTTIKPGARRESTLALSQKLEKGAHPP